MKQVYTTLFFAFCFLLGTAQDYNLSFEQWDSVQHHIEPRMWGTFNGLSEFGLIPGAERTSDAMDGQYALKLRTDSVPVGVAVLGTIYTASAVIKPGRPFNLRPDSVKFYYKCTINGGDSSAIVFIFTRWDLPTDTQKVVGRAIRKDYTTISNYTYFSMPVEYFETNMPDSMGIVLAATGSPLGIGQVGNTLWIDTIHFSYTPSAIRPLENDFSFQIFPNPTHDKLTIETSKAVNEILFAELYDATSRLVKTENIHASKTSIDVSKFASGIYYCNIRNQKGETLLVKKIVKE